MAASKRGLLAAFLGLAWLAGQAAAPPALATPSEDARRCVELVNAREELAAAIDSCTRAIGSRAFKGTNLAPLYYNRGWARDELGQVEAALEDYGAAIAIQPDYVRAYIARGYSHGRMGQLDAAIEDYSLVLRVEPEDFIALFNRGLAYEQQGKLDLATADYRAALRQRPDDARLRAIMQRLLILEE